MRTTWEQLHSFSEELANEKRKVVLPGLQKIKLRGAIEVDPRSEDFFRVVIQERKRLAKRTDLTEGAFGFGVVFILLYDVTIGLDPRCEPVTVRA